MERMFILAQKHDWCVRPSFLTSSQVLMRQEKHKSRYMEICLANEIKIIFYMIAMKGQLWDLHLPWQLSKVYLSTRCLIDAINISAELRSFWCYIIDCIWGSNQMFMAVMALLLLGLCHRGQLQVFPFKSLFDTFRQLKCTFMKGKCMQTGLLPRASQKKLNSRAPDRIQFESTTMSLAFNEILLPYFFTLKMCGHAERDLINKLQICC